MVSNKLLKLGALALSAFVAGCGGGGGGGGSSLSEASDTTALETPPPAISWHSAAEPLIQRYCVACHTEGGVAPFPLDTYQQVYGKRSAMAFVLEADTMPPLGYADLKPTEADTLLQWLADGAPQGDESQNAYNQVDYGFTYHGNTRAIIEKNCVNCHVDGGVAPFPLDTYERVKGAAAAALFAVENGTMPPWPPTMGFSRLKHERALSGEDEFALRNWLASDLAVGNPADYVPPEKTPVNDKIKYNIQMPIPEPYTPTVRPDDHRCFVMDWPLDELAYVKSVNVIPDQLAEVHHVIVNIIDPKDTHYYKNAGGEDGRPGWYCLGSGGIKGAPLPRQIGGWVPGLGNGEVPEGTGLGIEPGSLLVVQFHYNTLVAEPKPDQSIIQIATQDSVERPASGFLFTNPAFLGGGLMTIPAGDPDVHHEFTIPAAGLSLTFGGPAGVRAGDEWVIHNGFLHMHNLGKSGRTTLIRANGTEQVIVDIRDWDFNWQSSYGLSEELLVKPGDKFKLECTWDNSAANQTIVDGVQLPPRDVDWGDGTGDEMCLTNLYITKPKAGYDYSYSASVHIDVPEYRQHFAPGDLVPLELLFNNFTLHEPGAHGGAGHDMAEHTDIHSGDHAGVYEGHYHIYLDTDDDDAGHVTAWDAKYFYQLPDDLAEGLHTLRVSLRGSDHHALGIEQTVEIQVENTAAVDAEQLIAVNDWAMQSAAQDDLSGHRPAEVSCPDNSWYNEDGALEVETGFCNYLSLAQPSKAALTKGDSVHLVLWHGALVFEQPATAHVAIAVDGRTVWEENVKIPTDAEIYDVRIPIGFDAPVGSKVEFHLHNHGYNTWTLLQLEVER
jgi:mono/diheme cytochrome c family protein